MTVEAVVRTPEEDATMRIREGIAIMGHGVGRTLRSELAGGMSMSVVGLVWGLISYRLFGGDLKEKVAGSMATAFRWGAIGGWVSAPEHYNDMARDRNLPTVRWFDTLPAGIVAGSIYDRHPPFTGVSRPLRLAAVHAINPVSWMGARHALGGIRDRIRMA